MAQTSGDDGTGEHQDAHADETKHEAVAANGDPAARPGEEGASAHNPAGSAAPERDSPPAQVSNEVGDEAKPTDTSNDSHEASPEALFTLRRPLFRLVGRTYRHHFRTLLTVSVLPAVPVTVAVWTFLLLLSRDGAVIDGVPIPWDPSATPVVVARATLGVVAALVAAVSLGAGIIIGGAGLLGQEVTPAAALRRAVRRVPAILIWWLLVVVVVVAAFILGGWIVALLDLEVESPVWGLLVGLLPLLYFAWVVVALPVALLENKGLFRSLGAAWNMGLDQRIAHATFVFAAFGLGYGATTGPAWGLPQLGLPYSWAGTAPLIVASVATALLWPLIVLLLTAPVFLDLERPREGLPDRRRFDVSQTQRQLPKSATPPRWRPAPLSVLAAAIALLALLPTTALLNPAGAALVTHQPVDGVPPRDSAIAVLPQDDKTQLAVSTPDERRVISCDPECDSVQADEPHSLDGRSAVFVQENAYFAQWTEYGPAEDANPGLQLWACEDFCPETPEGWVDTHTTLIPDDGYVSEHQTVLTTTNDGFLVVSLTKNYDEDNHELQALHCLDSDCADLDTIQLPTVPIGYAASRSNSFDVAVGPDDEFALSGVDGTTGEVNLITCSDLRCEDPVVTQVAEPLPVEIDDTPWSRVGASVEVTPDGSPMLAYRAAVDGAIHFVACTDLSCDDFSSERITGPGWRRPAPALELDSEGLPQVATFDTEHERLMFVSCADSGCRNTTEVPLIPLSVDPQMMEMAMDEHDRPHIVWGGNTDSDSHNPTETTLSVCLDARCGA
ncbi:hypothetical protein J4H86_20685 [Spiractinospora alimapuensis]|uniref:hypothetical protein n=1 Tax=Spiractinospora alimapuensis TaxID=2820884 RepID=UPI001F413706|nr:hypothetical protein [Spiractinospora alimapuensis]QVQ51218.1 hypothetical protein J4H86_20685 [Spiractinospora alimapuensis]